MAPAPVGHDTAGELVDDLDLLVLGDEVMLVAHEAVAGRERLRHELLAAALALPEVGALAEQLQMVLPALGQRCRAARPRRL